MCRWMEGCVWGFLGLGLSSWTLHTHLVLLSLQPQQTVTATPNLQQRCNISCDRDILYMPAYHIQLACMRPKTWTTPPSILSPWRVAFSCPCIPFTTIIKLWILMLLWLQSLVHFLLYSIFINPLVHLLMTSLTPICSLNIIMAVFFCTTKAVCVKQTEPRLSQREMYGCI